MRTARVEKEVPAREMGMKEAVSRESLQNAHESLSFVIMHLERAPGGGPFVEFDVQPGPCGQRVVRPLTLQHHGEHVVDCVVADGNDFGPA